MRWSSVPDKDGKIRPVAIGKVYPGHRDWIPCECELDNGECDCFRIRENRSRQTPADTGDEARRDGNPSYVPGES